MELHYTHNVSFSSSDAQYEKYEKNKNNGNYCPSSSSSSVKDYLEKNKSENDWSKILINSGLILEEDINITNRIFEGKSKNNENKGNIMNDDCKSKDKFKKIYAKNMKNNKLLINEYSGKKIKILNNGIVLKNMNKPKKQEKSLFEINQYILSREQQNKNNNNYLKLSNTNNKNIIKPNTKPVSELLMKKKEEEKTKDSFHILYIRRPNRSFITKVCKYKKQNPIKIKEYKRLHSNLGIYNKINPASSRLSHSNIESIHRKKNTKSKTLTQKKYPILLDNIENKFSSISTTTNKKYTINSNVSFHLNKTNNLLINNNLKKRPLSSINVIKKEIDINYKANSKLDSFNNTAYNKSYNMPKTRLISSVLSTNNSKRFKRNESNNVIYENKNFIDEFKELKKAFEHYGENNNNINIINTLENKNFKTYREIPKNIIRENYKGTKKIARTLNSGKDKNTSYHKFYPKEISPLFDFRNKKQFEDEKQNKLYKYCSNCGYQKHFGNEKNCPVCITIKEQNQLKEEDHSNKKYYFPFKDKYETNNYSINTFRNEQIIFKSLFNPNYEKSNLTSSYKPNYIKNILSSPNYKRKKNFIRKNRRIKELKRNQSDILDKFDAVQRYFE